MRGKKTELITYSKLKKELTALGIQGKDIILHISFKKIGNVDGGIQTFIECITQICRTVVMPAYNFDSVVAPPPSDRPKCNGIEYKKFKTLKTPTPRFNAKIAPVSEKIGKVAALFSKQLNVIRSHHPWLSYAAVGSNAKAICQNHIWNDPHKPIRKLIDKGGYVFLVGVDFRSCSALHYAIQKSGSKPFVRWALSRQGNIRRCKVGGCGQGFNKLKPLIKTLIKKGTIGNAKTMLVDLNKLINYTTQILKKTPSFFVCSNNCIRCQDSKSGGPKKMKKY